MKLLEENRLISYRVVDVLNRDIQELLWSIYRRLEATHRKIDDIQKFQLNVKGCRITITIFEDNSHERIEIYYNNTIVELKDMCVWLNFWKLHPYVIMDVLHGRYKEGGRLDAR